jgi:hypothetical protein
MPVNLTVVFVVLGVFAIVGAAGYLIDRTAVRDEPPGP